MSFYSSSTSIWWNPLEKSLLPTYKDPLKVVMHPRHVWYWEKFLHEIAIDRPIQVRSRSQYYTLHSRPPIDDWVGYPPACKGSGISCSTICSSFSVNLSWRSRGILLKLYNIGRDLDINLTWVLSPFMADKCSVVIKSYWEWLHSAG